MNQNEQITMEQLNEFEVNGIPFSESHIYWKPLIALARQGFQLREAEQQLTVKRFIEIQLAEIEPKWTAEGKGGYWWGVKIGMETVLNKIAELEKTDL